MSTTNFSKTYSTYAAGVAYAVGDSVVYAGQIYRCIAASTGNLPTNTDFWSPAWSNQAKN